jgi:hypothetical protein
MTRAARLGPIALALGAALLIGAPLATANAQGAAQGVAAQQGLIAMHDLALSLSVPATPVVSGEDFLAQVSVVNNGAGPADAPDDLDEAAYTFTLTPQGGGAPIGLSADAKKRMAMPGAKVERNYPAPKVEMESLDPGEERISEFYPARYAPNPLPAGVYDMTAALLTDRSLVSPPVRLVVTPARAVALSVTPRGPMSGVDVAFVHRDADGHGFLFQGNAAALAPTRVAGLRSADLGMIAPGASVQVAQAHPAEDQSGPAWAAWLTDGGRLAAVLSYSAYVAGSVAAVDLGLSAATLQQTGWVDPEEKTRVSFAALGLGEMGPELALVRIDANAGWSAQVTRTPLGLSAAPAIWRLIPLESGAGHLLIAAMRDGAGAAVFAVPIGADGVAASPRRINEAPAPLVAMSVPRAIGADAEVHLLFGPYVAENTARMVFRRVPLVGGDPFELPFRVPMDAGATPTGWALADGAPPVTVMAAWLGRRLLGLKIAASSTGGVLLDGIEGAAGLSVITIGPNAFAVWRTAEGGIESLPFP